MPAVSPNQRIAAAIAEHNPAKLNPANRGMLSMSHQQLHDFASTPGIKKIHPQHALHAQLVKHMTEKPNDLAEGTNDPGKY